MSDPDASAGAWTWHSAYPAPAKLNLFLHVTGRRPDGYHLLQTAFRFVDRCDLLRFAPRRDGDIVRVDPLPGVAPADDLTVRAAQALQRASGCRRGVDIALEKRLPMGGGLGGGSSDAATVLLALNHLWGLGLPRAELQRIGLGLGADVPVFVFGDNAFAEGVGELLQPIALRPAWYVVIEPPLAIATAEIFRAPELRRDTPPLTLADWYPGQGGNDLQAVAVVRYPVLGECLAWLERSAPARMTGSGACVFAEFAEARAAQEALAGLPAGWRGWAAAGLPQHPLRALA